MSAVDRFSAVPSSRHVADADGDPAAPASGVDAAARHILVLLHDFPAGGSERVMIRLANRWAARGRRVTILCGCEEGPARAEVSDAVAVMRTPREIRRGFRSRTRLGRAIARLLPSLDADVLVAPGNFHLPVLRAVHPSPIPLVCKLSNTVARHEGRPLRAALFRWRLRRLSARLDLVVAISPALAREAAALLPGVPIRSIAQPNIADDAVVGPAKTPRQPPRLLCAGRLVPQKNVALALETLARLDKTGATLIIAGDGPERADLEALTVRLNIEHRVEFRGHVPDIAPLLETSDLLLSTSRFEGYPGVVVEALAAGVPIVTTESSPAIPEILADPSFGRIAARDPRALAEAVDAVLEAGGPDLGKLEAAFADNRVERSAAAWLDALDAVVRVPRRR